MLDVTRGVDIGGTTHRKYLNRKGKEKKVKLTYLTQMGEQPYSLGLPTKNLVFGFIQQKV